MSAEFKVRPWILWAGIIVLLFGLVCSGWNYVKKRQAVESLRLPSPGITNTLP